MEIKLSDHFDYKKLLRFTLPSIVMMVFTSIYGVVDGLFVSNFVDKTAFSAVNFIFPYPMMLGAVGFMFGTGGSALISKILGEGDKPRAQRTFTQLLYISAAIGALISVIGYFTTEPVARLLGAEGEMLDSAVLYGRIIFMGMPAFILQYEFQSLFATAEKPKLGLYFTVGAGLTNMVLDALLVAVFRFGLVGAAIATVMAQCVGGIAPLFYFARENSSLLRLVPARPDPKALLQISFNGSSELLSNISMSLVSMLYNAQLLVYSGEDGIAAYGVLMYINFVFLSTFIGYAVGVSPVVSFHFGAGNRDELKSLRKRSIIILIVASALMFLLAEALAYPLSYIYVGYDTALCEMTHRAFIISSFSFLFSGVSIFVSSFFTALNDGPTSALLSFARTIIFQVAAVLILPLFLGLDGIWLSVVVAELLSLILDLVFLGVFKKKYGY